MPGRTVSLYCGAHRLLNLGSGPDLEGVGGTQWIAPRLHPLLRGNLQTKR
jgi:hypothetical protein